MCGCAERVEGRRVDEEVVERGEGGDVGFEESRERAAFGGGVGGKG